MTVTEFSIDSRERDTNKYPDSNIYSIDLPTTYKNVYSIEIIKTHIPQSQYVIDIHNNKIYYQYENNDLHCIHISPCQDVHELLRNLNTKFDPMYISFTIYNNILTIHNNHSQDVMFYFHHHDSIGHVLGFPGDTSLKGNSSKTSKNPVVFQKEPSVFMNVNGYSHIDNLDNASIFYKHIFNKQNDQRHRKEFAPSIGKLFKLDISFHNYNNCLYDFHGYNHTFNIRLKYEQ